MPVIPQDVFLNYLTHQAGQQLCANYLNSTTYAQTKGKTLLVFETNTAPFPGISNSFGAALWVSTIHCMAYSNFSGAMFHDGG
jgi:hypothetical protein